MKEREIRFLRVCTRYGIFLRCEKERMYFCTSSYQVRSCTYNSFSNQCWSRLTDYKHIQLKILSILMLIHIFFIILYISRSRRYLNQVPSASGYILHTLFLDLSSQISVYFDLVIIQMISGKDPSMYVYYNSLPTVTQ